MVATLEARAERTARACHFLMCPPAYFDVTYRINPWMDPASRPDPEAAHAQWTGLRRLLEELGHRVDLVDARPGLPDMVFTANGATVVDDRVLVSTFRHRQRAGESAAFEDWFQQRGYRLVQRARHVNEGQGDHLLAGDVLLAADGFRTEVSAHDEARAFLGRRVVPLTLVDPRFYHLDTALAVLADRELMYYPPAFAPASRASLRRLFPDALTADAREATAFGLNAISDGRNVLLPAGAASLAPRLRARGFEPHLLPLDELHKAGGGPKCAVLQLHHARRQPTPRSVPAPVPVPAP